MKKLQVKYEHFDPILVGWKDGGGPRLIDVYTEDTVLFKDICAKAEKRFLIMSIVIILSKSYMTVLLQ